MLQSVEILQMNAQELTEYIRELSLENPVVDIEEDVSENKAEERVRKLEWLASLDEQNRTYYQYDRRDNEDYLNNIGGKEGESLKDALMLQLIGNEYSEREMAVFRYIADSLNSSGYYTEGLEELACRFGISEEEAAFCLDIMKGLEPAGVCTGSLKECMARQIDRLGAGYETERSIVENYLELLGKNQLPAIAKKMKISIEQVKKAADNIKKLNPRPAQGFDSGGMMRYIVPDVTIVKFQDRFEILQNSYTYPVISINQEYLQMLKTDCDKEVKDYLTGKIHQIEQVQEAIEKRGSTLLNLAKCLIEVQEEFFLYGQKFLRPLMMKEAAERLAVHESTISRTVKGKYLQCSWGIYPFSYFFSRGLKQQSGNQQEAGDMSTVRIRQRIKELIEGEDKYTPYSDQQLKELLEQEGIVISRRTIVKYREAMRICSSRGRKQF
jgi:RNA polymerase sigma-54 factor